MMQNTSTRSYPRRVCSHMDMLKKAGGADRVAEGVLADEYARRRLMNGSS